MIVATIDAVLQSVEEPLNDCATCNRALHPQGASLWWCDKDCQKEWQDPAVAAAKEHHRQVIERQIAIGLARRAALAQDRLKVRAWLEANGITLTDADPAGRIIVGAGWISYVRTQFVVLRDRVQEAFDVPLVEPWPTGLRWSGYYDADAAERAKARLGEIFEEIAARYADFFKRVAAHQPQGCAHASDPGPAKRRAAPPTAPPAYTIPAGRTPAPGRMFTHRRRGR